MSNSFYSVFGTYYIEAEGANYTYAFKVRTKDNDKIKIYQNANSSILVKGC